jgi:hypothetical protein
MLSLIRSLKLAVLGDDSVEVDRVKEYDAGTAVSEIQIVWVRKLMGEVVIQTVFILLLHGYDRELIILVADNDRASLIGSSFLGLRT